VLFTLVGIIYRKLKSRIDTLEDSVAELESQLIETRRDLEVAHTMMFGRDQHPLADDYILCIQQSLPFELRTVAVLV